MTIRSLRNADEARRRRRATRAWKREYEEITKNRDDHADAVLVTGNDPPGPFQESGRVVARSCINGPWQRPAVRAPFLRDHTYARARPLMYSAYCLALSYTCRTTAYLRDLLRRPRRTSSA